MRPGRINSADSRKIRRVLTFWLEARQGHGPIWQIYFPLFWLYRPCKHEPAGLKEASRGKLMINILAGAERPVALFPSVCRKRSSWSLHSAANSQRPKNEVFIMINPSFFLFSGLSINLNKLHCLVWICQIWWWERESLLKKANSPENFKMETTWIKKKNPGLWKIFTFHFDPPKLRNYVWPHPVKAPLPQWHFLRLVWSAWGWTCVSRESAMA